jgi:putative membrane protein
MTIRRLAALAVAALGLAVPAVALTATGAGATAPNQQDRTFLVAAHQANLAEIAAGRAAQQKATSTDVREHGQLFITDHTRLDAGVRRVATALGVTLPNAPNSTQQAQLAAVSAKSGAAFDRAWTASQLTAHRQALALGTTELSGGSDAQVKGLASTAAPVVQGHLSMLEQSDTAPTGVNAGTGGQAATAPSTRTGWALLGLAGVAVVAALALLRPAPRGAGRRGTGPAA